MSIFTIYGAVQALKNANISFNDLLSALLNDPLLRAMNIAKSMSSTSVLDMLATTDTTQHVNRSHMMNYVNNELRKQVEALTKVKAGYHFTAQDISVEQIEMCDIEKLSGGMEELAPDVWELLGVLLQADPTVNQKCK
ncbi:hypothetical protein AN958_05374 [Leucoagaricus sp. SymC.cos]|nr:hypothetical protein AN958_05374 [Leucoagaricus sp. SymC.cos]